MSESEDLDFEDQDSGSSGNNDDDDEEEEDLHSDFTTRQRG
jgi:hypothetical protein